MVSLPSSTLCFRYLAGNQRSSRYGRHNVCLGLIAKMHLLRRIKRNAIYHLFYTCPYSFSVWTSVSGALIGRTITPDLTYTLQSLLQNRRTKQDNILLRLTFQSSIYHLWRERNRRRHNKPFSSSTQLACTIDKGVHDRLLPSGNDSSSENRLLRWQQIKQGVLN